MLEYLFGLAVCSLLQSERWNGIAKGEQNASANGGWKSLTGWLSLMNATKDFWHWEVFCYGSSCYRLIEDGSWNMSFICRSMLTLSGSHCSLPLCPVSAVSRDEGPVHLPLPVINNCQTQKSTKRWSVKTHSPSKPPYLWVQVTTAS